MKVLGGGGLRTNDSRRWQSGPHLSRSIELLDAAFDHLDAHDLRVFLSERAQRRLAVEHDERLFDVADVLELHGRLGCTVIYDHHHHRCNVAPGYEDPARAIEEVCATWSGGVRPKLHLSSPRTELRVDGRAPLLDQHADFVTPWDLRELLDAAGRPVDLMIEAKAKDLAVAWLRKQLERLWPGYAAAEERSARRLASGRDGERRQVGNGARNARVTRG